MSLLRYEDRAWRLRRSDRTLLSKGYSPNRPLASLVNRRPKVNGYGEEISGTSGYEDPSLVMRLVCRMVQQRWSVDAIRAVLMDPKNAGGVWLRRQPDPEAALQLMLSRACRSASPYIPMKERHKRILSLLRENGPMRKARLIKGVGHVNKGHVLDDIKKLDDAGLITVTAEPHGKIDWYWIELAVAPDEFDAGAAEIRRRLAKDIARSKKGLPPKGHKTLVREACLSKSLRKTPQRRAPELTDADYAQMVRGLECPNDPVGSETSPQRARFMRARILQDIYPNVMPWDAEHRLIRSVEAENRLRLRKAENWEGGSLVEFEERDCMGTRRIRRNWAGGTPRNLLPVPEPTYLSDMGWWLENPEAVVTDEHREKASEEARDVYIRSKREAEVAQILGDESWMTPTTVGVNSSDVDFNDELPALFSAN